MHDFDERHATRRPVRSLLALVSLFGALALITAGNAVADEPGGSTDPIPVSASIAAADGPGWIVFKGHRSEREDKMAPSSVPLKGDEDPSTPASADLQRWGATQAQAASR